MWAFLTKYWPAVLVTLTISVFCYLTTGTGAVKDRQQAAEALAKVAVLQGQPAQATQAIDTAAAEHQRASDSLALLQRGLAVVTMQYTRLKNTPLPEPVIPAADTAIVLPWVALAHHLDSTVTAGQTVIDSLTGIVTLVTADNRRMSTALDLVKAQLADTGKALTTARLQLTEKATTVAEHDFKLLGLLPLTCAVGGAGVVSSTGLHAGFGIGCGVKAF